MNPFDQAWIVLKAPVYVGAPEGEEGPPTETGHHYEMLPHLEKFGGFMWQSEDGMSRGTMRPDFYHNSLLINNFEMGGPMRGKGNARDYLQQMIDDGHAHFEHELDGVHVTNVEPHTVDFWNKLVDEGMFDGAHERGHIRVNLDGDEHYTHAYDKESKQPWLHELSEDYAEYHGLPTEQYIDNALDELHNMKRSEPMDLAMQLLKGIREWESDNERGQAFTEDLFEDYLHEGDLMPYEEMTDRQRAIIDTKMSLPAHLFSEGSEMGVLMNRFLFSRSMHESIPDVYYEDELEYLNHFKDALESVVFPNGVYDHDKAMEIMDGGYEEHPEHPHAIAISQMHPSFTERENIVSQLYGIEDAEAETQFSPEFQDFHKGEPMDLTMRLLKEEPLFLQGSNTLARRARKELETDMTGANSPAYQEMMERLKDIYEPQDETISLEENLDQYAQETGKNPWRSLPGREMPNKHGGNVKVHLAPFTPIHPQPFYDWQAKNASEPMDIAMRLLKDRKSPEAFRHKKEYDTKYESSPERVKYREELNRERRRRGMYGDHSGRDISHTQGGKLTVESEHANRARHFKNKGTLRVV